jgi:3-hydroxyacyl-[acyl-carrier-protein] dehydratase
VKGDPVSLGLPHRSPFVFLDTVEELQAGESAQASKLFRGDEPFFAGHFPGNPIVPGVLLTEAMAQTAGLAVGRSGEALLLSAIRSMKFLRPVRPREQLRFKAERSGQIGPLVQCSVECRVEGELVAEGQIILSRLPPVQ